MYIIYCYATNHPLKLMAWATPILLNFRKCFSFNYVCVYVCQCGGVCTWLQCPEAVPTGARLPGSCKQPGMGTGKQTQVFCKGIHTLNPRDVSAAQSSLILFAPKPMGPAIWAGVCWVVLLHVTVPGLFMWLQPPAASTQRCLYVSPHLRSSLIGHGVAHLQAL